ncbi:2-amino-4-hydroxy-6-hydroxymethyldihydropteridine diphosphokinase [Aliidiomarina quisquiliarum]|uniref:2-amino-4-hydroxy-6- hydroxymethyldihydropteridine diphosphokinase n=1 Tax=Aliidiomarina quisquiliarum TaxID=2938947 RepID=UPI00208F6F84|nr:2-amino-4-hydroxy-6-hydroxymethyldihydropteridine diphosphokinase [Aliidiomarina quisquiliarum]MCO4320152.1 2-amino-4-hydroxy-6-hydroxymethyldihydropteridine diphosphokinase [Aliidiomarina quisquiliarum]
MTWHYLSLGSNLKPEHNLTQAIRALSERFGELLLLPVVRTQPCNMNSVHDFLNTLIVVHSALEPAALKQHFNSMEENAGRDRSDPERGSKDRPLDIDILTTSSSLSLAPFYASTEPYCLASVQALVPPSAAPASNTVALALTATQLAGQRAATINANHGSGHILVVENTIDSLLQRLEAAFSC